MSVTTSQYLNIFKLNRLFIQIEFRMTTSCV
jgi:hypothetical protein